MRNHQLYSSDTGVHRVVRFYKWFTLGDAPLIVLKVMERKTTNTVSMAGVVRNLVDTYKLRIVVDCSSNTVDELFLKSQREDIIEIHEMTQDMISIIPQFQQLHTIIKQAELTDVVWKVLGGIPFEYARLWDRLGEFDIEQEGKSKEVIGQFLCDELFAASQLMLDARDDLEEIVKLYVENGCSLEMVLVAEKDLKQPSPDKIFRRIKGEEGSVLVPASKALAIVLEHKLTERITLDALLELM